MAVFGATSAIAVEILRTALAERSAFFLLLGRDSAKLEATAADLTARGARCAVETTDLTSATADWKKTLLRHGAEWDVILIAHGSMPDQTETLANTAAIAACIAANYTSHAIISAAAASLLEKQQHGTIAVIGSVAGDRGRGSNFLYGSAKAGIDTFLAGLRHKLAKSAPAVRVVTLKPGMTDTPMTAGMPKGPLFSSAPKVGACGWQAIRAGKSVAYLPGWWRLVMFVIRSMPTFLLHRSNL